MKSPGHLIGFCWVSSVALLLIIIINLDSLSIAGSSLANLLGLIATIGFLLLYFHGTRQVNLYATVPQSQSGGGAGPGMATAIA